MSEKSSRRASAAKVVGSVVDVFPLGSYLEYMPRGTTVQRIGSYFDEAAVHFSDAYISKNKHSGVCIEHLLPKSEWNSKKYYK